MLAASLLGIMAFRKYSWLLFLLVLVGYKNILSTTGFHFFTSDFASIKAPKTLRILSWNVNEFYSSEINKDTINNPRRKVLAFIKETNADILCFQDFKDFIEDKYHYSNTKYLKDSLNYPYVYLTVDHYPYTAAGELYGTAIFSKYPIIDTGRITYDSEIFPEHIGFANIEINKKVLRFYNTHLSSMQLTADRKNAGLDYTYMQDDTAILLNKSKLERISFFDSFHVKQAQLVKQQLNAYNKPFIFCADLNSVPSSYVYQHISKGLQDAFLQTGFGWGPTYDGLSHTLRIDVTLLSPQLKVVQHYCPKLKASDHFPLVTDIALP
jgi:endonuclease/exonuclease/phosphatase family metal-dependent hydrolase